MQTENVISTSPDESLVKIESIEMQENVKTEIEIKQKDDLKVQTKSMNENITKKVKQHDLSKNNTKSKTLTKQELNTAIKEETESDSKAEVKQEILSSDTSSTNGKNVKIKSESGQKQSSSSSSSTKKVYVPNLNVVRNKNLKVQTSKDTTERPRVYNSRGRGGRGRGQITSQFPSTFSVFSEFDPRPRKRAGGGEGFGDSTNSKEAIRKQFATKANVKSADENNKKLESYLQISDDEIYDNSIDKDTRADLNPIKLNIAAWRKQRNSELLVNVQLEDLASNDPETAVGIAKALQALHVRSQQYDEVANTLVPRYRDSLADLFQSEEKQLFVMQLPDALPCMTDEDTSLDQEEENNIFKPATAKKPLYDFRTMDEGQIGKILRYKSGKVQLLLGETKFDLSMGTNPGCLQELVSITTNEQDKTNDVINLGPVGSKIMAVPDWEQLFDFK